MITRRFSLLLNRHHVHPLSIHQRFPGGAPPYAQGPPPPQSASTVPPGMVSSSTHAAGSAPPPSGKSATPSHYQLELQSYLNKLRWYYQSRIIAATPSAATSLGAEAASTPRRPRRNGFIFSAATLFMIPYLLVEDWLGHVYAMRTQQFLREARDQSTKCKVIEVKRTPTTLGGR